MTYPSGEVLYYDYGSTGSLNDVISRLNSMIDGSTTVEGYAYLGLSTVVIRSHPEDGVDLTYVKQPGEADGDSGDQYAGLDRFGRVVLQRWIDAGVDQDRYLYAYDRNGNVVTKTNALDSSFSETYTYDALNRLLTTTRDGTTYQTFGMDAVGNIDSVTDAGGTTTNTTNDQNELITSGGNTLAYDDNGNTTTDDQGHTLVYDAWNRLVEVKNGGTILELFTYNGLGQQITETSWPISDKTGSLVTSFGILHACFTS